MLVHMAQKKLYRSTKDQMVAGVLSGMAEYFDQDPTIWRLGFVFFMVITGLMPGVLMYVLAWVIIPLGGEPGTDAEVKYTVHE